MLITVAEDIAFIPLSASITNRCHECMDKLWMFWTSQTWHRHWTVVCGASDQLEYHTHHVTSGYYAIFKLDKDLKLWNADVTQTQQFDRKSVEPVQKPVNKC